MTPMQEGMYFHYLLDKSSGAFYEQVSNTIRGELHVGVVHASLEELIERHDILRTAFTQDQSGRPLQVVLKKRKVDFVFHDLCNETEDEQARALADYLTSDRTRGFILDHDILIRFALFRLSPDRYEFVRSHHHIIIDGWCTTLLLKEYLQIYHSRLNGQPHNLPEVKQFSEYIKWLERFSRSEGVEFWANYLSDIDRPTGFISHSHSRQEVIQAVHSIEIDQQITEALKLKAQTLNVTLSTLYHTCWAFVISYFTGETRIVFGSVVSGRPAQIEGIENMMGLFINTIPVKMDLLRDSTFSSLATRAQNDSFESEKFHYISLADIQAASPLKESLIDHAIIFENFPVLNGNAGQESVTVSAEDVQEQSNYPLDVRIHVQ